MPAHIVTSMIGQVLRMCKDYIACAPCMHMQCFPHAICQDTSIVAAASYIVGSSFFQSSLPYGRREWVVGHIPRFVGDLN